MVSPRSVCWLLACWWQLCHPRCVVVASRTRWSGCSHWHRHWNHSHRLNQQSCVRQKRFRRKLHSGASVQGGESSHECCQDLDQHDRGGGQHDRGGVCGTGCGEEKCGTGCGGERCSTGCGASCCRHRDLDGGEWSLQSCQHLDQHVQ